MHYAQEKGVSLVGKVGNYNDASSLVRFENKNIFRYFEKTL
jgi:hypothetical protein